jgi:iron-sulfur cluster insertion protein
MARAAIITFSERAVTALNAMSRGEPVALALKSGGCAGFSYDMKPIGTAQGSPRQTAEILLVGDTEVHIDEGSLLFIIGTKIDWKQDLMGARFTFQNPNAESECGCGTSFAPVTGT